LIISYNDIISGAQIMPVLYGEAEI
jgi:hypothetical protein